MNTEHRLFYIMSDHDTDSSTTVETPYFKLHWLPHTLFDQRSHLQSLFVSTVKHHAMISGASSDASNVAKDDDYFGFTESTDGTPSATDSYLSQTLHSATKFELEALNFSGRTPKRHRCSS